MGWLLGKNRKETAHVSHYTGPLYFYLKENKIFIYLTNILICGSQYRHSARLSRRKMTQCVACHATQGEKKIAQTA
jgi:cytochrome c553